MNNEYYYIKLKSIDYDKPDWFLANSGLSPHPGRLKIFNNIDEAIEAKNYYKSLYAGYYLEIVRF